MKKTTSLLILLALTTSLLAGCTKTPTDGGTAIDPNPTTPPTTSFDTGKFINVVSREDGSGTRGAFIELFGIEEKAADGSKKDKTTKEAVIASKTDIMLTNISGDEYAIGYVSLGSLSKTVKAVNINSITASAENVKNGTYKINRPFNIATKGEPTGVTKDFIHYILSAEGQTVVAKSYIAISENAPAYTGTKPSGKIVIVGSSSITPIMEKLKEAYLLLNPNATIEIQQSDSTAGMTGAMDGTCDIGMASRSLKDSELKSLTATKIALDGIAVIVNSRNPLSDMTTEEVSKIFTGAATTWNEIIQ